MRTTLTLDDDVAAALDRLRRARRESLRTLVNKALREGLRSLTVPPRKRTRTRVADLGLCRPGNVDNVVQVLAMAENDS